MFQAVSPRQRAAWVYLFKLFWAVSPRQRAAWIPLITFQAVSPKQWTAWVYLHFPKKCSPLLYQKQCVAKFFRINVKVIIPRFGGGRSVDNLISRYVGWRDVAQFPSQVSFPVLSDDEMSKVSCPVCLVQRCHQPKRLFLQTISLQNTFQISQYNYQHGSGRSLSPAKLQYPLGESGPFLQRIWVSLYSYSFKTNHLHHPTFIITSQAFITS